EPTTSVGRASIPTSPSPNRCDALDQTRPNPQHRRVAKSPSRRAGRCPPSRRCRASRRGTGPTAAALEPAALATLARHTVDFAQYRLEGVAQCHGQLFAGMAADPLMTDHNGPLAGDPNFDLDAVDLWFERRALGCLEHDAATRHALEMLLQFRNLFAYPLLDGFASLD